MGKIDDPLVQARINELYEQKLSNRNIALMLNKEGIKISHMSVGRYLGAIKERGIELAKENPLVNQQIIDTTNDIELCQKQARIMLENFRTTKELKIKAMKMLLEITRMVHDIASARGKSISGNVIIKQAPGSQIQFVQDFKIYLEDLEGRGDITINNPMLKLGYKEISKQGQPKIVDIEPEEIEMEKEQPKEDDENGEGRIG